jgi:hypothetical protein
MTTLRPLLVEDASGDNVCSTSSSAFPHQPSLSRDTPSPSSCSSTGSTPTKAKTSKTTKIPDVNQVLDIVEKFTLADKVCYHK